MVKKRLTASKRGTKHDAEKWVPIFGKIMLEQKDRALDSEGPDSKALKKKNGGVSPAVRRT
jgi:hypothetical protein